MHEDAKRIPCAKVNAGKSILSSVALLSRLMSNQIRIVCKDRRVLGLTRALQAPGVRVIRKAHAYSKAVSKPGIIMTEDH